MKSDYPKIFEPITIKRTTIKNRIAMTPMGTNYGETSGEMSNRHMNYYSLRAKGGTGLIILENANIEYPAGSNGTSQIRIDHDSFMPRYYQLVENLHKNGATVAIQVNHAGASASSAKRNCEYRSVTADGWIFYDKCSRLFADCGRYLPYSKLL